MSRKIYIVRHKMYRSFMYTYTGFVAPFLAILHHLQRFAFLYVALLFVSVDNSLASVCDT
jgi:hypothetical protein